MAQPIFPLVNRLLGGKLPDLLREKREAGETHERIARWLHTEHDIDVTAETVRGWCNEHAKKAS